MTNIFNMEIKAKYSNPNFIRKILKKKNAEFIGKDNQKDIYFNSKIGRLKLRKGNIENNLIFYNRNEFNKTAKESEVVLLKNPNSSLENILTKTNGIKVIVHKKREIYIIDNIKFHIDEVKKLGKFIEIEVKTGECGFKKTKTELKKQLEKYKRLFKIKEKDYIKESYSDLLLKKK